MSRATLTWDGAAWLEESELPFSSRVDRGFAPIEFDADLGGLDPWRPPHGGPRHLSDDGAEQYGQDGIGGWVPMPSAEEERAAAHDDDFMLAGGALRYVPPGASESVAMDPKQVDRMRRRLETLRRHELADDFRPILHRAPLDTKLWTKR